MKIRILSFTSFSRHALIRKVVVPTIMADQKAAMRTIVSVVLLFGSFILLYRSVTDVVRRIVKATESSNDNNKSGYHTNQTKEGGNIASKSVGVRSHRLIALKKNRRPATVMMPVKSKEVLVTSMNSIESIQFSKGIVETLAQLTQQVGIIYSMLLRQSLGVLGVMTPHQVDQELDLLGV